MNFCYCGAEPSYPHAADCPYPCYNLRSAAEGERWARERRKLLSRGAAGREPFTVEAFAATFAGGRERYYSGLMTGGNLARALRMADEECGGIPGAWVVIRYRGEMLADLDYDYRGERDECHVFVRRDGNLITTEVNTRSERVFGAD